MHILDYFTEYLFLAQNDDVEQQSKKSFKQFVSFVFIAYANGQNY